ncbi:hypothetical protein J4G48_0008050 [Bradyrhizobium barranii subsp. apii]|uniref:hypothetical protein n=1 Tax=Bradyrhizobium barranii TaxID=2992140 RepID=UPI001AA0B172|nr:hypothetical protein [Bradyrhizobium barranii]UPT98018.1 hypothetical protein J4G48_0008050 [Bradyrhizobium barranii subsp. apii]
MNLTRAVLGIPTRFFPVGKCSSLLQFVIVSKPECVLLGHDEPGLGFGENLSSLKSRHATANRLERQAEEARERRAGHPLLDRIRLDRVNAGKSLVQRRIVHHIDDVRVENRMNDQ